MKKLITIALLALATTTTVQAKIGDTFTDPELGKITVKAPNVKLLEIPQLIKQVNGKQVFIDHPQTHMMQKTQKVNATLSIKLKQLNSTSSQKEIVETTKVFIKGFQELKTLRKAVYLEDYNKYILWAYKQGIKDAQRAFKYQFWDYFKKIKGTPEFEQLKQEINFSSQILDNLKLYEV
ncbi:hypothetical protein [Mannheimia pernigra]|uniref:Uncharacterized protein n=1 Tax=Mannheimia pernigra TaxID=111844 RepID=A0A7D5IBM4_9PAST|nr:hypothetical protein [Mannheimia pernigra]QLB41173.1 hypothetical protein HV559_10025 [Mannheimia pernigra]